MTFKIKRSTSLKIKRSTSLLTAAALAGLWLTSIGLGACTAQAPAAKGAALPSVATSNMPAAAQSTVPIGANLEGLADWMSVPMFADAMKTSRAFGTADKPWEEIKTLDADGYPITDAGVVVFSSLKHPGGTYHFSCAGKVTVAAVISKARVEDQSYSAATGRTTAEITVADDADQLMLTFRNTSGGVKDIHLMRPGYTLASKQIYTNGFLALLRPFSTIRLMDYMSTNGSPVVHWSDRAKRTDAQYTHKGGSWEDAIALANGAGKDLWINVPDQADDDYVKQLATLFKTTLNPGHKVYLEYSNEVWNWGFAQATRNQQAAEREVAADPKSPLRVLTGVQWDDADNKYYWGTKRVAARLMQIRTIWEGVYGKPAFAQTVRPVLASQIANDFLVRLQMGWIAKQYGPPSQYVYAIAGAPYFNLDDATLKNPSLAVNDVLTAFGASIDKWGDKDLLPYAKVANQYGVKYFAYEGGADIGQTEQSVDAKVAANRDPRMKDLTARYLTDWYSDGGDLFMYFSLSSGYSKWGCWGLTDDILTPTPKIAGLAQVMTQPRPAVKPNVLEKTAAAP